MSKAHVWASFCLLSLVGAQVAEACVNTMANAPPIQIRFLGDGTTNLRFLNYSTFPTSSGSFCACAFKRVAPITSVNSAQIMLTGSNQVLGAFDFNPNATTGTSVAAIIPGNWNGFQASLSQTVAGGQAVDVQFNVTVPLGTSFNTLSQALSNAGVIIATDEANPDGSVSQGHFHALPAGNITQTFPPTVPATSHWSMILLATSLVGVAVFAIRRQA